MLVLRCTQKLLARLKKTADLPHVRSTTRLGDWYGNTLRLGPFQFLIFISEHSRLSVVLPAREAKRLPEVLSEAICEVLTEIGIPAPDIEDERVKMSAIAFGRTQSRSVLGTLTDYSMMARHGYSQRGVPESPETLMRFLAQTPILPLGGASPLELTRAAFKRPSSAI